MYNNEKYDEDTPNDENKCENEGDKYKYSENTDEENGYEDRWNKYKEQQNEKSFTFNLKYKEVWKPLRPSHIERKASLKRGWTDIMARKINETIPGCVLSFRGHDLTAGVRSVYITAVADCKHEESGVFKFTVDAKPKYSSGQRCYCKGHKVHTREKVKK